MVLPWISNRETKWSRNSIVSSIKSVRVREGQWYVYGHEQHFCPEHLSSFSCKEPPVQLCVALGMLTACCFPALKEKSPVTHQVAGNYLNHSNSFGCFLYYYHFSLRKGVMDFNFTRFMSDFWQGNFGSHLQQMQMHRFANIATWKVIKVGVGRKV